MTASRAANVGKLVIVAALAILLISCASNQRQNAAPVSTPTNALTNDTGLPLPENATIIDSRKYQQTIDPSEQSGSAFAAAGKGTYDGHEVIASSSASYQDLAKWLESVPAPAGMKKTDVGGKIKVDSSTLDEVVHKYGIDYAAFVDKSGKGATVVVMDPKTVTKKLGVVLTALQRYNTLPEAMRQAMDEQIKQRTGFSVAELTDKSAPLGAALAAMSEFRDSDARAIILLSGERTQ